MKVGPFLSGDVYPLIQASFNSLSYSSIVKQNNLNHSRGINRLKSEIANMIAGYFPDFDLIFIHLSPVVGLKMHITDALVQNKMTVNIEKVIEQHWLVMMKCQFDWWRKPEYPEETTDLRQATLMKVSHIYDPCLVPVPNPGCSGVKPREAT